MIRNFTLAIVVRNDSLDLQLLLLREAACKMKMVELPRKRVYPWLTKIGIIRIVLGISSIALAFAWGKFINAGLVYFPFFPDILDVTLGVIIGLFLLYEGVKRN